VKRLKKKLTVLTKSQAVVVEPTALETELQAQQDQLDPRDQRDQQDQKVTKASLG
jgi:hypothetical protein